MALPEDASAAPSIRGGSADGQRERGASRLVAIRHRVVVVDTGVGDEARGGDERWEQGGPWPRHRSRVAAAGQGNGGRAAAAIHGDARGWKQGAAAASAQRHAGDADGDVRAHPARGGVPRGPMPRDAAAGRGGARASILAPITRERRSLLRRHARGAQRRRRGKRGGAQGPPPSAPGPADLGRHGKRRRRPPQARVHREQRRLARPRTSRLRHRVRRAPRLRAAAAQRQRPASPFPRIPGTNPRPTWHRRDPSDPAPTATGSFLLPGRPSTAYLRPRRVRAAAPSSRASCRSPRASRARRGAASFRRSPPSARRCDCGGNSAAARSAGALDDGAPTGLCVVSHRVLGAPAGGGVHALAQRDDRAAHALALERVRGSQSPSTRVGEAARTRLWSLYSRDAEVRR